jgi:hypothetical protein
MLSGKISVGGSEPLVNWNIYSFATPAISGPNSIYKKVIDPIESVPVNT